MTQQNKVQTFSGDNMVRDSLLYLRSERNRFGLTQGTLAEQLRMDRSFLSSVETSAKNPTMNTMIAIADGLGLVMQLKFSTHWTSATFSGEDLARNSLNYLRSERKRQDISQLELAERLSMDRSFLSTVETSTGNPTIGTILAIAKGLGLDVRIQFKLKDVNLALKLDYSSSLNMADVISMKPTNIKVFENGEEATSKYADKSEVGEVIMERDDAWEWRSIKTAVLEVKFALSYVFEGKTINDTATQTVALNIGEH